MVAHGTVAFAYHKAVAPMLWVLVGLSSIELVVVHLLLSVWWPRVAIVVAAVTLVSIVWLVMAILSFRRMPVLVGTERLVMRVGRFRSITVPVGQVMGLRTTWDAAAIKRRDVLNLALVAYPNVVVDLDPPIVTRRGRTIAAVAHRLDDPHGFARALERLGGGHG